MVDSRSSIGRFCINSFFLVSLLQAGGDGRESCCVFFVYREGRGGFLRSSHRKNRNTLIRGSSAESAYPKVLSSLYRRQESIALQKTRSSHRIQMILDGDAKLGRAVWKWGNNILFSHCNSPEKVLRSPYLFPRQQMLCSRPSKAPHQNSLKYLNAGLIHRGWSVVVGSFWDPFRQGRSGQETDFHGQGCHRQESGYQFEGRSK